MIEREITCKPCGNFVPLFCMYLGKTRLIESDALHLDDPMRCVEGDHDRKLFIRPRDQDGRVVESWLNAK